jgi:hypothetical protein
MKRFAAFILLSCAVPAWAQYYPNDIYPAYCVGNRLFSNRHKPIYQFSFSIDCSDALAQSKRYAGRFCDNRKLVRENGTVAHDFTFRSDCQDGLNDLDLIGRNVFCDGGSMRHIYRGAIANLTFESDCKEALFEVRDYNGLFCNGGVLMNHIGERLGDYTFSSNCKEALRTLSSDVTCEK